LIFFIYKNLTNPIDNIDYSIWKNTAENTRELKTNID